MLSAFEILISACCLPYRAVRSGGRRSKGALRGTLDRPVILSPNPSGVQNPILIYFFDEFTLVATHILLFQSNSEIASARINSGTCTHHSLFATHHSLFSFSTSIRLFFPVPGPVG